MHDTHKIERRKSKSNFYLQKMELIYDSADGETDIPHRHDYYTVLLVEKASGVHLIDFNRYPFSSLEVHFVSPGQVHQVVLEAKPKGWVFTFSRDFLMENNISESFISNINLFQSFDHSPPLRINEDTYQRLRRIIDEMTSCIPDKLKYGTRALGALLQLFLIYCNNSSTLNENQLDEEGAEVCLLRDFKNLVEDRFNEWHQVKQYASEINISPKHLSQTVKNVTGKVAKAYIQDRIILESKRQR